MCVCYRCLSADILVHHATNDTTVSTYSPPIPSHIVPTQRYDATLHFTRKNIFPFCPSIMYVACTFIAQSLAFFKRFTSVDPQINRFSRANATCFHFYHTFLSHLLSSYFPSTFNMIKSITVFYHILFL